MNPALKFIFARRSIRKYQNKDVSKEIVKDLLEAAMSAPSAVAKTRGILLSYAIR